MAGSLVIRESGPSYICGINKFGVALVDKYLRQNLAACARTHELCYHRSLFHEPPSRSWCDGNRFIGGDGGLQNIAFSGNPREPAIHIYDSSGCSGNSEIETASDAGDLTEMGFSLVRQHHLRQECVH